jgi:fumarate hydratase subunit alpha
MLDTEELISILVEGFKKGATDLPADVTEKLRQGLESEESDTARMQLSAVLENIELAKKETLPLCQDTGIQVVFIKAGYEFPYLNELVKSVPKALVKATDDIPLRPNTVNPFTGENPKNNLGHNMPAVTVELVAGDSAIIHILPKGGGSENMSALWMLMPTEGLAVMKRRILERVQFAAGKPCPPIVLGIGIGGGADIAMKLAKKALLRPLNQSNADETVAALEKEILDDVNSLGIGSQGLGGKTTALAVNIEYTYRHPATFPVALVVQCWCDRRAVIRIDKEGVISSD